MTTLRLAINAMNPGEYLASCGLIEVVGHVDPSATSAWGRNSGLVAGLPNAISDVCEIQTNLSESDFARELSGALGSRDMWKAVTASGRVPLADAVAQWTGGIELDLSGCGNPVVVDHWYEWAIADNQTVALSTKKRDGKSRWKFWAGQQDKKGITGLLIDLVDACAEMKDLRSVQDIVGFASAGSGRLNLDAATTRSSIDRGISANDAGRSIGRPGLELLAAVGLASFFPPRRYGDAAPDGTVRVQKRVFRYWTWRPEAPICLARMCARGADVMGFDRAPYEAMIGTMGQYSYLRYARAAGDVGVTAQNEELMEDETEEDTDE